MTLESRNPPSRDSRLMGIALNVSRARLTVLGFALAVNVFAIGNILQFSGGAISQEIILELNILIALLCSVALGTSASILFLISERLDPAGPSDPGIFGFGEMTMYVALGQTLNGISQEFLNLLAMNLGRFATGSEELASASASLESLAFLVAAVCWTFTVYVAPAWSILRHPLSQERKRILAIYYAGLFIFISFLNATAVKISLLSIGETAHPVALFLKQLWAPMLWNDLSVLHEG